MGKVIPTAAALGVNVEDIGAALATLTAGGIKTDEAVTALNQTMIQMVSKSKDFEEIGIDIVGILGRDGLRGAFAALDEAMRKDKWIINICKGLLAQHATDAQTIAFTLQRTGADVQENDVRNAMKTPEALALFQRVRAPSGRIEWIRKEDAE